MSDFSEDSAIAGLTAEIVSAYVSNNTMDAKALPGLIAAVREALASVGGAEPEAPPAEPLKPAVPIRKSITPEYLVCLEDGKRFKSLKRHLRTRYNLTPDAYRQRWGLPADYPMVAPNYAETRSSLAKQMGLGRRGK